MNYELAKKLKDAGYPQKGQFWDVPIFPPYEGYQILPEKEAKQFMQPGCLYRVYPTLSELIEACGDKFESLFREKNSSWWAEGLGEPLENLGTRGKTPEEAVAKLWLKLNIDKLTASAAKGCLNKNIPDLASPNNS